MRAAIKFLLVVSLVQCTLTASIELKDDEIELVTFESDPLTTMLPDPEEVTPEIILLDNSTIAPVNYETDEVCTCCPTTPSFINDDTKKIEDIKNQLKADMIKLEEEFTTSKKKLQEKLKELNDQAEPIKEKLREVRKVNRDKETELNIEEMSEKSLLSRRDFKKLIDKMTELSDSRLESKNEYKELKTACRVKKGDSDYDEEECTSELAEKLESIEKANADISSTVDKMKLKHEEIVELENQIKVAEDGLWTAIFENREKIKDDIERMDEIYEESSSLKQELETLGKNYEKNQQQLNQKAREALKELLPDVSFSWISWSENKKNMPKNAIYGGYDLDQVEFYVIRREKYDSFEYGKFAAKRGHAYINRQYSEYGVTEFDILVGTNLVWCRNTDASQYNSDLPICRMSFKDSLIPGTFLEGGKCRVGFGYEAYYFDQNFEILKQGSC